MYIYEICEIRGPQYEYFKAHQAVPYSNYGTGLSIEHESEDR
jgi:hypothetical protein